MQTGGFNLNIQGDFGNLSPSGLASTNSPFEKVWTKFLREITDIGCTINGATFDVNGKKTTLPVETHAAVAA